GPARPAGRGRRPPAVRRRSGWSSPWPPPPSGPRHRNNVISGSPPVDQGVSRPAAAPLHTVAAMPVDPELLAGLRAAVEAVPDNLALRLHVATVLLEAGRPAESLEHSSAVLALVPRPPEGLPPSGPVPQRPP